MATFLTRHFLTLNATFGDAPPLRLSPVKPPIAPVRRDHRCEDQFCVACIWGRQHWLAPLAAQHHQVSGQTAAAVVLGRRAFGHSARRRPQASPGVTTPDQGIEAAGQRADVESYPVECAGMAGTGCEGRTKFRRREGNHNSGARPETATATLAASRSGKTARPDRVSLMGTPQERCRHMQQAVS